MTTPQLLVVDDDAAFRATTAALLRQDGHSVRCAGNAVEAIAALAAAPCDLILLDIRMPGLDGIALVEELRRAGEGAPILMVSGFGTVDSTVAALHAGADDFLTKPVDPTVLSDRVQRLLLARPGVAPRRDGEAPPGLIGRSAAMRQVIDALHLVAPTDTTVLLTGETGTGKEVVARALHQLSSRRRGPFIAVNCAGLADGVLESELFGHVRGAFTGAVRDKVGLFAAAHGGTILLDEIGGVSPAMQYRLLRVLQEREVTPVGATHATAVDVRVVAATNRDLRAAVADGAFREDLYYRLKVFSIELPPLRERDGDVLLIAQHVLTRRGHEAPRACTSLALRLLREYHWPGNVRELLAVLESAAILAGAGPIQAQHLPAEVRAGSEQAARPRYRPADRHDEAARIRIALAEAGGVRARAAERLGMNRTTLWRKLKRLENEDDGPRTPIL